MDEGQLKPMLPPCRVCGETGAGFHYGANTCEACKGFFHRSLKFSHLYKCTGGGNCDLKKVKKKRTCQLCRYKKCIQIGMSKEAIKTGRYTSEKKTSDILEVKRLRGEECSPLHAGLPIYASKTPELLVNTSDQRPDHETVQKLFSRIPSLTQTSLSDETSSLMPQHMQMPSIDYLNLDLSEHPRMPSLPSNSLRISNDFVDVHGYENNKKHPVYAENKLLDRCSPRVHAHTESIGGRREDKPGGLWVTEKNLDERQQIVLENQGSTWTGHHKVGKRRHSVLEKSPDTSHGQTEHLAPLNLCIKKRRCCSDSQCHQSSSSVCNCLRPSSSSSHVQNEPFNFYTNVYDQNLKTDPQENRRTLYPDLRSNFRANSDSWTETVDNDDIHTSAILGEQAQLHEVSKLYQNREEVVQEILYARNMFMDFIKSNAKVTLDPVQRRNAIEEHLAHCNEQSSLFGPLDYVPDHIYDHIWSTMKNDAQGTKVFLSQWQTGTENMVTALVRFCKHLPGFKLLDQPVQTQIIKSARLEFNLMVSSQLFDTELKAGMCWGSGSIYCRRDVNQFFQPGFIDLITKCTQCLQDLELTEAERAVIEALIIFATDRQNTQLSSAVAVAIHWELVQCLRWLLGRRSSTPDLLFAKVISCLTELRAVHDLSKATMEYNDKSEEQSKTRREEKASLLFSKENEEMISSHSKEIYVYMSPDDGFCVQSFSRHEHNQSPTSAASFI